MKRVFSLLLLTFLSLCLSLPAIAGPRPEPPASAPDGFNMRNCLLVRGAYLDNRDFLNDSDDQQYFTQILESIGTYGFGGEYSLGWWVKVSNGVWGYDFNQDTMGGTVTNEDTELEIDMLYAGVKNETLDFKIGLVPMLFGNAWNLQTDGFTGSTLELYPAKGMSLTLLGSIIDENDYNGDATFYVNAPDGQTIVDGADDQYLVGVQIGQRFKDGDAKVYYMARNDDDAGSNLNSVGFAGRYMAGDWMFDGEAMTFFGEASDDSDYVGNQVVLSATYNMPSGSIQANLYYAQGADADETQASGIQKQGMIQPFQQGLGPVLDHNDDDIKLLPKPTSVFMIAQNSGVMGLGINGSYRASEQLTLSAGALYLEPEEEDDDRAFIPLWDYSSWTSLTVLNAGVNYRFSKHLQTGLGMSYKSFDSDDTGEIDDAIGVVGMVAFEF